tara:strand:+ start:1139 stop:1915 length:777 start_codon:yes stop_codon:yes gene_type:complete
MSSFDEKASKRVESVYSTTDIVTQRKKILELLAPVKGEKILDLGVGPGFLTKEISEFVDGESEIIGIDNSEFMLEIARKRCSDLSSVTFKKASATSLPFPDSEFDAVVVSQVYEYVSEIKGALSELFRVLKPGGRALIMDTDWDSLVWNARDKERATQIFKVWEQHLFDPNLPSKLSPKLIERGFKISNVQIYPILNLDYIEDSFSYGMISVIVPFVINADESLRNIAKDWAKELKILGAEGSYFFSLNRYVFQIEKI